MTEHRANEFVDRMNALVESIQYKDWKLRFVVDFTKDGNSFVQWVFVAPCAKTGVVTQQFGRKWRLSLHMTDSEIVTTAFKAALTAEEHECREMFKYKGGRIFNPHISVDALLTVCNIEDSRE